MTTEERALLLQRLSEAESALHQLMCGLKASVIVDQNGERVEFQQASRSALAAYVQDLKRQLGLVTNTGPMRVWF